MDTNPKTKSASTSALAYLRNTFLGATAFTVPTGLPYDASLAKIRDAHWESDTRRFVSSITDETDDSAEFEIKLLEKRRSRSSNFSGERRWMRVCTARGRIARQAAFDDAVLHGEVTPPPRHVLFLSVAIIGVPVMLSSWIACGTVDVMTLVAYTGLGTWAWFDISRQRRSMLAHLQSLFADDEATA